MKYKNYCGDYKIDEKSVLSATECGEYKIII